MGLKSLKPPGTYKLRRPFLIREFPDLPEPPKPLPEPPIISHLFRLLFGNNDK